MKENDDNAWELIALKISGEATEVELQVLEGLTNSNPELSAQLQLVEAWWNCKAPANETTFPPFFEKLQHALRQFPRR